mmetsp:Transcript_50964/g.110367  ORF Transcript_50964/g.110367 Transcript_50964/m.110367 type:complete len:238 (+) Transcript_50964:174-887(+)
MQRGSMSSKRSYHIWSCARTAPASLFKRPSGGSRRRRQEVRLLLLLRGRQMRLVLRLERGRRRQQVFLMPLLLHRTRVQSTHRLRPMPLLLLLLLLRRLMGLLVLQNILMQLLQQQQTQQKHSQSQPLQTVQIAWPPLPLAVREHLPQTRLHSRTAQSFPSTRSGWRGPRKWWSPRSSRSRSSSPTKSRTKKRRRIKLLLLHLLLLLPLRRQRLKPRSLTTCQKRCLKESGRGCPQC